MSIKPLHQRAAFITGLPILGRPGIKKKVGAPFLLNSLDFAFFWPSGQKVWKDKESNRGNDRDLF